MPDPKPSKKLNDEEKALLRMLYRYGVHKPKINTGVQREYGSYYSAPEEIPSREMTSRTEKGEYVTYSTVPKRWPGEVHLTTDRADLDKIGGRENYDERGEFRDPAFVLAHELGHHFQLGQQSEPSRERRKKLDKHLTNRGGNQYDLRQLKQITPDNLEKDEYREYRQREADTFGQALINLKDDKESKRPYINAYQDYITNMKRKRSYRHGGSLRRKYNFGGALKKALPIAGMAANLIPGVGPLAGMAINAGAGALANGIPGEQEVARTPGYANSSYGYRTGGILGGPGGGLTSTRSDTSKVKSRRSSQIQKDRKTSDQALQQRMKKMRSGDYSMVGEPVEFEGPSHEGGGIDIGGGNEVEGGETMDFVVTGGGKVQRGKQPYIFSKDVTVPGSDLSFAKYHKQLVKRGVGEEAIRKLAHQQEKTVGGNRGNPNEFRFGGSPKKKYNTGGLATIGGNNYGKPLETVPGSTDINVGPASTGRKLSTEGVAYGAAALPDLINVATGMFSKDKTRPATKVSKGSLDNLPSHYNVNPALQSNRDAYRSIIGDPNASTNVKLAAQAQKMKADSKVHATKANEEGRMATRKASLEGRLDSRQASLNEQHRQDKMASEANLGISGNFARQGLAGLSGKVSQIAQDLAMKDMDNEQLEKVISMIAGDNSGLYDRLMEKLSNGQ